MDETQHARDFPQTSRSFANIFQPPGTRYSQRLQHFSIAHSWYSRYSCRPEFVSQENLEITDEQQTIQATRTRAEYMRR